MHIRRVLIKTTIHHQSPAAEITDTNQVLEPKVIQALITGKKLVTRTRSVIMREDKPVAEKKKEAVRPPRPIVQPPARKKTEAPKEEPVVTPPPSVIIPEFVEAAEAEERAAKEAPTPKARPKKVAAETHAAVPSAKQIDTPVETAASVETERERPAAAAAAPASSHSPSPTGPTGPRA